MPFPVRFSRGLKFLLPILLLAYGLGSNAGSLSNWIESGACVVLLLGSVAIHEFGHVAVVRRLGLTVRSVTLTVFGGLTHYEGTDLSPLQDGCIAFAGPLASAVLATVLLAGRVAVGGSDVDSGLASVLTFGIGTNALIAVVNLVPLPSLDGGKVTAALWRAATRRPGRAA